MFAGFLACLIKIIIEISLEGNQGLVWDIWSLRHWCETYEDFSKVIAQVRSLSWSLSWDLAEFNKYIYIYIYIYIHTH